MRRRASAVVAALLAGSLVVAGCSGAAVERSNGSQEFVTGGTFTMTYWSDPGTFDPYRNQLILNYYVAYDSLVNLRPDGKFVSGLAEKWTADATSATFTLRSGVTCSDGTPLTASQVATAIEFVSNPKNGSPRLGFLVPSAPMKVTGDDSTGTVKVVMTREPFGFLLNTVGRLPIVCAAGMKNPDLMKTGSAGTGPFVLTKVVPGDSFTFSVRKGYEWGPDGASTSAPGTPETFVLKIIANESTAANLLLSGGVNFARIAGDDRKRLESQQVPKVDTPLSGAWLWFNQMGGRPTADKRVRQALVQALDREQVVKVSTDGAGGASTGLVTQQPRPCTSDTITGKLPGFDKVAAESLLDQAGWRKGPDGVRSKNSKPLELDLHYVDFGLDKRTAQFVADQWKAVGIQAKLTVDTAAGLSQVMFQTSNWDVYLNGFGYLLPSQAVPYNSGPAPPQGTNLAGIKNADYERLIAKAATMVAPEACRYWDEAEQALYREVDIAPMSNRVYSWYLKNARAEVIGQEAPIPTSIRMLG